MWETKIGYALHAPLPLGTPSQRRPCVFPPGFHHWLWLDLKPQEVSAIFQATRVQGLYIWEPQALWLMPLLLFFCRIVIWASSCFKLFVHFGPSNDALSIGRSCWFWHRDGARCRLESLLMVMTHRCLNPIVLGRVGWWVKASRRDLVRGDLVPPHWVEANCGTLWIPKTTLCILWGREFSYSNLMAPDCLRCR